jgi:Putative ABC-transporter type IV
VRRFLAYGVLGLGVEVVFTSISRALRTRDARLVGRTYLWMLPIYGAGGLVLERLHARLVRRGVPAAVRALASTGAILGWEYASGSVLRRALGDCPWRYRRGVTLGGYVRLDYSPYWYGAALLFELLQHEVRKLDRARRGVERRTRGAANGPAADAAVAGDRPEAERRRAHRRAADRAPSHRAARRRGRAAPCAADPAAPGATASA